MTIPGVDAPDGWASTVSPEPQSERVLDVIETDSATALSNDPYLDTPTDGWYSTSTPEAPVRPV